MKYSKRELVKFGIVGASGFAVNAAALAILHQALALQLIPAQLIAGELAIISNFTLHHNWTYSAYVEQHLLRRFLKFNASMVTGSLITLVVLVAGVQAAHLHYLVALVGGAAVAMLWNLVMNKLVIWRFSGQA